MLLLRLYKFSITREIWTYFTTSDILQLLATCKDIRELSFVMNREVPRVLKIYFSRKILILTEDEKATFLKKIMMLFPNISKISLLRSKDSKMDNDLFLNSSLLLGFYNCISVSSLVELSSCVHSDYGLNGISKLVNLTSLKISSCSISDLGLCLLTSLSNITSLDISKNKYIKDFGLICVLTSLQKLLNLNISSCDQITDTGLSGLANCTNVNSLNIAYCNISDVGLSHLSVLTNLTRLDCENCYLIMDTGLIRISSLTKLSILDLSSCSSLTNDGVQYLSHLTNLTSLNLAESTEISDYSFLSLLAKLKSLSLYCCDHIERFPVIPLNNLTDLDLAGTSGITDEILLSICSFTNLTSLKLDWWIFNSTINTSESGRGFHGLSQLKKLENFDLEMNFDCCDDDEEIDDIGLPQSVIDMLLNMGDSFKFDCYPRYNYNNKNNKLPFEFVDGVKGFNYIISIKLNLVFSDVEYELDYDDYCSLCNTQHLYLYEFKCYFCEKELCVDSQCLETARNCISCNRSFCSHCSNIRYTYTTNTFLCISCTL